jgi:hypothetical protein
MSVSAEILSYVYIAVGGVITILAAALAERWAPKFKRLFWIIFILLVAGYIVAGFALQQNMSSEASQLRADLASARHDSEDLRKLLDEDKGSREDLGTKVGKGQKSIEQLSEGVSKMRGEEAQKYDADIQALVQRVRAGDAELQTCRARLSALTLENSSLQAHNQVYKNLAAMSQERCDEENHRMLEAEFWPTKNDESRWPAADKVFRQMPSPLQSWTLLGRDRFVLYQIIVAGGTVDEDKLKLMDKQFRQQFGDMIYDQQRSLERLEALGFVNTDKNSNLSVAKPLAKHLHEYLAYVAQCPPK